MHFTRLEIPEVVLIEPQIHGDARGYFVETYRRDLLEEFLGEPLSFVQDNESLSGKGVLRGLHYQLPPAAQSKLVRVVRGRIQDVAVDIRPGSPTFGRYVSVELSSENKRQVYIPRGFAHGFLVLEEETIVAYKTDAYYAPQLDRGIAFDDPEIGIEWLLPVDQLQLSERDRRHPVLEAAELFPPLREER